MPGRKITYTDDSLGRPVDTLDMDQMSYEGASLEEEFREYACPIEGVSGLKSIDSSFENTVEAKVGAPRSDRGPRPYKPGKTDNPHNSRFGATTPPNHAGVDNPAPVDTKSYLYPQRRY